MAAKKKKSKGSKARKAAKKAEESLEAQMQRLQIEDDDAILEEAMKLAAAEKKELETIDDLTTECNEMKAQNENGGGLVNEYIQKFHRKCVVKPPHCRRDVIDEDEYKRLFHGKCALKLDSSVAEMNGTEQCTHGHLPSISGHDFRRHFVNLFRYEFAFLVKADGMKFSEPFLHAEDVTKQKYLKVWEDSSKLELIKLCLLSRATKLLLEGLEGSTEDSRFYASVARYLEEYIELYFLKTQTIFNWTKILELLKADEHTLVKYLRKRIPCSCLDKKYDEVKHIKKVGFCDNRDSCTLPDRKIERRDMLCCTRCRATFYCSRECQVAAWQSHKEDCKRMVKMAEEIKQQREVTENLWRGGGKKPNTAELTKAFAEEWEETKVQLKQPWEES